MAKKSKKMTNNNESEFITVEITSYHASVNAARNCELANIKWCNDDTKIFDYWSKVEIEGNCIFPENLKDMKYIISIYGMDSDDYRLSLKLKDCHATDDNYHKMYKTVKGERIPVYEIPDSIGYIRKLRGENCWSGAAWVAPRTVTDMLTIFPHIKPIYFDIHRIKKEGSFLIRSVLLRTDNPV